MGSLAISREIVPFWPKVITPQFSRISEEIGASFKDNRDLRFRGPRIVLQVEIVLDREEQGDLRLKLVSLLSPSRMPKPTQTWLRVC